MSTAGWKKVRRVRHNGQHGRLVGSEEGPELLLGSRWESVRRGRHNCEQGRLEESEAVPA